MSKVRVSIYIILFFLLIFSWIALYKRDVATLSPEMVKVAIRSVGHELLLHNNDKKSLVLPVLEIEENRYQLAFERNLKIDPELLIPTIEERFLKANLPQEYIVEVKQCMNPEVIYSYGIKKNKAASIITCKERVIPMNCYLIEVLFIKKEQSFSLAKIPLILLLLLPILFMIDYMNHKKHRPTTCKEKDSALTTIGCFAFYPEQLKLIKEAEEIPLSRKECELLAILVENLNEIVTREELTKRVWEDNGVFVGRSLDTYISKLRKKLKDDPNIKITNIHGVGYKLKLA
ncbi:MAG: winged helix-turn-helix transcriptional regulator [Flavobacteriaceae bacterium]|nr:winged helix-turn-helix transcriptional regulator [Flavobacteriaceae bacterium]